MDSQNVNNFMDIISHHMNWLHTALRAQAAGEACPPLPQKTFASLPMAEREAFKSRFDRAYNQGAEALINVNESLLQSLMALNEDTAEKAVQTTPPEQDISNVFGNVHEMASDIAREMKRLDRSNSPLCIVNLAVDQTDDNISPDVIEGVGQFILKTVRAFDDVYNLGGGEFVLNLKDIDIIDAYTVVNRMCAKISDTDMAGDQITVSAAIVMPEAFDKVEDVLENAKTNRVDAQDDGGDRVYSVAEKSPLASALEQAHRQENE